MSGLRKQVVGGSSPPVGFIISLDLQENFVSRPSRQTYDNYSLLTKRVTFLMRALSAR